MSASQVQIESIQALPDRNFCAGAPRNPATYVAYADDGSYYEGFVSEHVSQAHFAAEALDYFNQRGIFAPRDRRAA